ncbi:hypothetical protein, partial [Enterobacter intestinihominis]
NNVPELVGPVSAAPPGVKAGSVVRSGGVTPGLSPTETGQKQKTVSYKNKKLPNKPTGGIYSWSADH